MYFKMGESLTRRIYLRVNKYYNSYVALGVVLLGIVWTHYITNILILLFKISDGSNPGRI